MSGLALSQPARSNGRRTNLPRRTGPFIGVDAYFQGIVKGVIIVAAVVADQ